MDRPLRSTTVPLTEITLCTMKTVFAESTLFAVMLLEVLRKSGCVRITGSCRQSAGIISDHHRPFSSVYWAVSGQKFTYSLLVESYAEIRNSILTLDKGCPDSSTTNPPTMVPGCNFIT